MSVILRLFSTTVTAIVSLSALAALSGLAVPAQAANRADAHTEAVAASASLADSGTIDTSNRAQVLDAYTGRYLPAYRTTFGWTGGNVSTCQPGHPHRRAARRVLVGNQLPA